MTSSLSHVKQFALRGAHWSTQDPFLFIAHHKESYPAGNEQGGVKDRSLLAGRNIGSDFSAKDGWSMYHGDNVPGFPRHPHCGFETITLAETGLVDHSDSMGCGGRFGEGDVQWMTAGKGIQHSEMFPLRNPNGENPLEIFQVWLNLPKKSKNVDPYYSMLWKEDFGTGNTKVICGPETLGSEKLSPPPNSWAADPDNHVWIRVIKIPKGETYTIDAVKTKLKSDDISRTIYFFEGCYVTIGGRKYTAGTGFECDALQPVEISAVEGDARLVLLQGKKIQEPVAQRGPFVGNTSEDLTASMQRYYKTDYGGWPWKGDAHVYPLQEGRFSKYLDGSVEKRS